ncbi:hypothetical protein TNCV_1490151 [Trichonephila clavipes]|nr:hypothetical protein TNCV_1490151 [Trichonephila clavipes]
MRWPSSPNMSLTCPTCHGPSSVIGPRVKTIFGSGPCFIGPVQHSFYLSSICFTLSSISFYLSSISFLPVQHVIGPVQHVIGPVTHVIGPRVKLFLGDLCFIVPVQHVICG